MKILYVEDEIAHVELARRTLESNLQDKFELRQVDSLRGALSLLESESDIDLVLTDLRLPDGSGLDLVKKIGELQSPPAVVLVTGQGDQEIAVAALKAGAADYLVKQSDYLHRLPIVINHAIAQNRLARQQAALQRAEIKYQSLIEQTPAVVFLDDIDDNETTLYISPRIEELAGYTPAEWLSDPLIWANHIHPADKTRIAEADHRTHKKGEHFQEEYRFIRRDGRVIWIKEDTNLIRDKDGKPLYWQGILIDITKEKATESAIRESEERFRRIFHASPIAICVVTLESGRFIDANAAFLHLTGKSLKELIDRNSVELGFWEEKQDRVEFIRLLQERGTLQGLEIQYQDVPDGPKDTLANYELIELGGQSCVLAMFYEVTEQKKAQRALQKQLKELSVLHSVALAASTAQTVDQLIEQVTEIIGNTLYPDNFGILLVDEKINSLKPHPSYRGTSPENIVRPFPKSQGITGKVAQTGKSIRVGDVSKESSYIEATSGVQSELCVPIILRGAVFGVLNTESRQQNAYTERDESLLTTIANTLATAADKLRAFEEEQQHTAELETLYQASKSLAVSLEPGIIAEKLILIMSKLLGYELASVYLLDEQTSLLVPLALSGQAQNPDIYEEEMKSIRNEKRALGQGIIGWVAQHGESIRSGDITTEPRYLPVIKDIKSELCVPMIARGRVIGALNVESTQADLYSRRDESLLTALANSAAITFENARLFQSEQKRRQEAETLRQAAAAISSTFDPNQVLEEILKALKQVIYYDNASVFLHEGAWLRLAICQGLPDFEKLINRKFPANDELFIQIQASGRPIIISDAQKDPRFKNWGDSFQIHGWLAVPLVTRGRVIGYITLDNYMPGAYNETIAETALAFANQAAAAIENARLYNETQRRLQELEIINRVSMSLRVAQSLEEMLPILLIETLNLVNTPHGSIWLYEHSIDRLVQRMANGAEAQIKHKSLQPSEGIIGHTFTTGSKYTSQDFKEDPMLFEENRESMTPGLGGICIPIQSTAGPVGVLVVAVEAGRPITEETNLLSILAEITGNAIHRAQLYEQSQEQVKRLTTLRDIDAAIASSFDLRLTLTILVDQSMNHLKVDAVDIALYHPDLQSLTYLISSGFHVPTPTRPQIRISEGLAGQVIIRQQTYHVTDLQNAPEARNELLLKREGFVTYIGIPLIVKGQIKGIFEVFNRAPLSPSPDWMGFLQTLAGQAAIAIDNSQLFENLQRTNQELIQAYDTTLEGWARALELRDRETEGHTRRVTDLTLQLAKYMGIRDADMVNILRGVLLHDIGKMGVPDNILKKTGKLTEEEWNEMRLHPVYAYNLLSPISYLRSALDIPYCHHEHWDGSGYPRGLKGEQIPLSARIFSVVDIWDALLSDRPYRTAWPRGKVIEYLKDISGKELDPGVVSIFLKMMTEEDSKTG